MTDIQTDPNIHLKVKKLREWNTSNISVYNSKYHIGFEFQTVLPALIYRYYFKYY